MKNENLSLLDVSNLAGNPQLLRRKIDAVNALGIVGERKNIGIVSTILDSRLILKEYDHGALAGINAGQPGTGKSSVTKKTQLLYPESLVQTLTSATAKSIFYLGSDLKHKILILEEAGSLQHDSDLTEVIRQIISEGQASHQIAIRAKGGEFKTQTIRVEGPIVMSHV